ncbi:potassium transporter TrkA [Clostridium carboxidivorans P7]|uniref:TrkA C-terminal domain-containing protein n=1 Tax=Clostridium carboxidivorans TaxID=217159 RepID=UPI0006500492|nr:TrkA C-terminal domain-containing protein [Clostridium carboxidivorans]AKN30737.1 potassium transporter TrkA [Clostridium carboxidivorans P7]
MLLYFLLSIILFLLIVEIITVFFKLTGLSEEKSRFQVISLLTGSGFTTKEAELITQHPTRRRLAQILMILGYVGFLTGISFLVDIIKHSMSIKNLPILIIFFIFMWLILREKLLIGYLDNLIEKIILKKYSKYKSPTKMYKLVTRAKGYGVYNIVIDENSGLVGVALKDSNLKPRNMIILNIDKGNQFIGFPKRDYVLEKGDNILLYGKVEEILKTFHLNKPPKKH